LTKEEHIWMWADFFWQSAYSGHQRRPWNHTFFKSGFFLQYAWSNLN
jgi:hypothetical protein